MIPDLGWGCAFVRFHKGISMIPLPCCVPWLNNTVHSAGRVLPDCNVDRELCWMLPQHRERGTLCILGQEKTKLKIPGVSSTEYVSTLSSWKLWVEALWVGPVGDHCQTLFWVLCSVNYTAPLLSCQLIVCFYNSPICSEARMKCPVLGSQRVPLRGHLKVAIRDCLWVQQPASCSVMKNQELEYYEAKGPRIHSLGESMWPPIVWTVKKKCVLFKSP